MGRKQRSTYTALLGIIAGCDQCGGDDCLWSGRNALGVAAKHHDATGHNTWAEQTIKVWYGEDPREIHKRARTLPVNPIDK